MIAHGLWQGIDNLVLVLWADTMVISLCHTLCSSGEFLGLER